MGVARQLAGMVEFRVEVGLGLADNGGVWGPDPDAGLWDEAYWNASDIYYVDATELAISVNTSRGRDRWETRFTTGTASCLFDNDTGILSLDSGELGSIPLRPGRAWRLSGRVPSISQVWEPLFVGAIDEMGDVYYRGAESVDSQWRIVDAFGRFAIDNPPALESPVGSGELTSERVTRILDEFGWPPTWRDIQIGVGTMQSTDLAGSRLEELQTAADAEGGALFMDRRGDVAFKDQDWLTTDPRSTTPVWVAGNPGDAIQVIGATTDWSLGRVRNDIRMARKGSTEIRLVSDRSISLYGRRTFQKYDLEVDSDAQVSDLANRYLAAFQWDRTRIETITLVPTTPAACLDLLQTELGDRIRVRVQTLTGWSYTAEYYVNRISHNVTADDWEVTLRVDTTDLTPPLESGSFVPDAFDEGYQIGTEE